jgi:methyl-accepting chemotaxis protein
MTGQRNHIESRNKIGAGAVIGWIALLAVVTAAFWPAAFKVFPAFGLQPPRRIEDLAIGVVPLVLLLLWLLYRASIKPIVLADVSWTRAVTLGAVITVLIFWGLVELRTYLGLKSRDSTTVAVVPTEASDGKDAALASPAAPKSPRASYVLAVLLDNGWFQVVIVWCFAGATTALALKAYRLCKERSANRRYLMASLDWPRQEFTVHDAAGLLRKIWDDSSMQRFRRTALVRHIELMLERVENTKSSSGVDELMNSLAAIDADASASSFGGIAFLIYLMPAVGFLGTIYGVGQAIYGFSLIIPRASDFVSIGPDLTRVTHNLGVAFDTTLLGLVLSALAGLGMTVVRQFEENTLGQIDSDCVEMFRSLTHEDPGTQQIVDALKDLGTDQFRETLDDNIVKLREQVDDFRVVIEGAAGQFRPLTERMQTCASGLQETATQLQASSTKFASAADTAVQSAQTVGQTMTDQTRRLVEQLGSSVAGVSDTMRVELARLPNTLEAEVARLGTQIGAGVKNLHEEVDRVSLAATQLTKEMTAAAAAMKQVGRRVVRRSHWWRFWEWSGGDKVFSQS